MLLSRLPATAAIASKYCCRCFQGKRSMSSYYAVARGFKVGIFDSWKKCQVQVTGFKGAKFKKFPTYEEAESFIKTGGKTPSGGYRYYSGPGSSSPGEVPLIEEIEGHLKESGLKLGKYGRILKNKRRKSVEKDKPVAKEFWPEDAEAEDISVAESELQAAMDEVEGIVEEYSTITYSETHLKRKHACDDRASTSKIPKLVSKSAEPTGMKQYGRFEFFIDFEGYVIVYTDGSCLNNGQPNACAGLGVYFNDDHPLNLAKPVTGRATNNVGEIQAAIYAIQLAKDLGMQKLCICTDSQFMINAITKWIGNWKRKMWCLQNGKPVKNKVDFKKLDELLTDESIKVKWNYVKAHHGIKGNEMADKLARQGAEIYRQQHLK